jgi:hypothetical protein
MFAVRFFAAAMLLAAVPCASAAEPLSSSSVQISLRVPRPSSIAYGLLTADPVAAISQEIPAAPPWQPPNQQFSGLAAVYQPAGPTGVAAAINLSTFQPLGFQPANTPMPFMTNVQLFAAPTAARSSEIWLTPMPRNFYK